MALEQKEKKDDRLDDAGNPANKPTVDAGIDQAEAYANDPSNSTKTENSEQKSVPEQELATSEDDGVTGGLNEENGFYNSGSDDTKGGIKGFFGRISRSQKIGLGVGGGGIVALVFVLYPLVQGPLQLINFSQFLTGAHFINNQEFGNDRTSKLTLLYRYARGGTVQATRVGSIQAKLADRWDDRLARDLGVRPAFDVDSGLFRGLLVIDESKATRFLDNIDQEIIDPDVDVSTVNTGRTGDAPGDFSGARFIAIKSDPNFKGRRSIIRSAVNALDYNKISSVVGSRTLIRVSGVDFSPLKNRFLVRAETDLDSARQRKTDERAERTKSGQDTDNSRLRTRGTTEIDGEPVRLVDNAAAEGAEGLQSASNVVDESFDAPTPEARNSIVQKLLQSRVTQSAAGVTAVIGVLCTVKDLGNQAEELQFSQTILPMIRIAFEFIAVGSQIQSGRNLDLNEVGYYASLLNSEDGQNIVAAASIQKEQGKDPTGPDINPAVKPDSVNGKPQLFELIDGIPVLQTACNISNGIGSFIGGIPVVGNIVEIAGGVVEEGIDVALKPTGRTLEELISSVVSWLAGEAVNVAARGPELGNIANYGARLAANNQSIAGGGRELSGTETVALNQRNNEISKTDVASKSIFSRYFDIFDGDSLANIAFSQPKTNPAQLLARIFKTPQLVLASVTPSVYAQESSEYDYGFPEVGFSIAEIQNPEVQDPVANAEFVKANLVELNFKYDKCFPLTINSVTEEIELGVFTDPDIPNQFNTDEDCNAPGSENIELLRYRMYIADLINAVSIECYEGITASCEEIGFTTQVDLDTAEQSSASAVDCTSVAGNEKIACAAQEFFGVRYANYNTGTGSRWLEEWGVSDISGSLGQRPKEWIEERVINGENDFMECSGFTNVAIYAAHGIEIGPTCSAGYLNRTDYFTQIDPSEAQPGDFLIKSRTCGNNGHIGIFYERNTDGSLTTMESSAGSNSLGEKRTGFYSRTPDYYPYAVRYIGPGSGL